MEMVQHAVLVSRLRKVEKTSLNGSLGKHTAAAQCLKSFLTYTFCGSLSTPVRVDARRGNLVLSYVRHVLLTHAHQ